MDDNIESVLLVIRECYVYKIPSRMSSRGYRAAEWGDMESPLWKGRLRIVTSAQNAYIRLEDSTTGELFAVCPYDDEGAVEAVLDSSRYFVLRVVNEGRKAFIGMGFRERTEAFDFNVALQDHVKHVKAEQEAAERKAADVANPVPKKDYSLKEGQTISISIGGKTPMNRSKPPASEESAAVPPLLPPPPRGTTRRVQPK
ncbi:uncharacterized protein VTP21DRAFT_11697 [Calcarisporiella thermophila]|uniref:uncharacterized protein n=1 Tax=Calcarisporiella thermophila TaxID=911321 RepID=UPI0037431E93